MMLTGSAHHVSHTKRVRAPARFHMQRIGRILPLLPFPLQLYPVTITVLSFMSGCVGDDSRPAALAGGGGLLGIAPWGADYSSS